MHHYMMGRKKNSPIQSTLLKCKKKKKTYNQSNTDAQLLILADERDAPNNKKIIWEMTTIRRHYVTTENAHVNGSEIKIMTALVSTNTSPNLRGDSKESNIATNEKYNERMQKAYLRESQKQLPW